MTLVISILLGMQDLILPDDFDEKDFKKVDNILKKLKMKNTPNQT